MKETQLESGWLKRQMDQAIAEVASWPQSLQAFKNINDSMRQKVNRQEFSEALEAKLHNYNHCKSCGKSFVGHDGIIATCAKLLKAEDLLRRILQWDHLGLASDGAYWKLQIADVLGLEATESKEQLIAEIIRLANFEVAIDNYKKHLPKRTVSELEAILRQLKASAATTERSNDET